MFGGFAVTVLAHRIVWRHRIRPSSGLGRSPMRQQPAIGRAPPWPGQSYAANRLRMAYEFEDEFWRVGMASGAYQEIRHL